MKTIGMLGGMSPESTILYYRIINEVVRERLGGLHTARIILYSVDFHEVQELQHAGDWQAAGQLLADAARSVEAAGADFLLLCTNTMHKVAPAVEAAVSIPLLHIADATADAVKQRGVGTVGLLATRFTLEDRFYRDRLNRHGIIARIPDGPDREIVHTVIYDELCRGLIEDASREEYRRIIEQLVNEGAEGIILGCTEISLLIGPEDSPVPIFDTTSVHVKAAVEWALG